MDAVARYATFAPSSSQFKEIVAPSFTIAMLNFSSHPASYVLARLIVCYVVLIAVLGTPAKAQDDAMEMKVDSIMSVWNGTNAPGAAVAYFDGAETVFQKAYGLANLEHQIVYTTNTVSDLGSVSKQFIGFAMALLAERGQLSLDDDIRKHLPTVTDFGETITIRQLLNHTSGLREIYTTLALVNWKPGDGIFQEDAQTLISYQKELQFPPGSRYLYNNTEYMLLADIVEVVSGNEFHEWMSTNIFQPLEMDDTTIMHEQGQVIPRSATSYTRGPGGSYQQVYDNSTIQGAGGIYSTVEDLGKWIRNFSTHTVGTAATIESLVTPGTLTNGEPLTYALGMGVSKMKGVDVWSHSGSSAGYRAYMFYLPKFQRGFVFLKNSPEYAIPIQALASIFLGDVLEFPASENEDEAAESKANESAEDPQAYLGRYLSDELEVFYEIKVTEDGLQLFHRWLGDRAMTPFDDDVFELDGGPSSVAFSRNEAGSVVGFTLDDGRTIGVKFRRLDR